ncbi:MAG: hypothetical protein E6Q97_08750 [Desulfurellales bacterium]|nr:MAG: hypothetical protein E6Q97_08750 [Desulfurellales bacterium]
MTLTAYRGFIPLMKKTLLALLFFLVACDPADYNPHRWFGNCLMYDMKQPVASKTCTSLGLLILTSKDSTANDVRVKEETAEVFCGLGEQAYSLWYITPLNRTDFEVYATCNPDYKVPIKDWFTKHPESQLNLPLEHSPPIPGELSDL